MPLGGFLCPMSDCEAIGHIWVTASPSPCDDCPPERVCAWACMQGMGVEEIVIGAALAREGVLDQATAGDAVRAALWGRYNAPPTVGECRNPG